MRPSNGQSNKMQGKKHMTLILIPKPGLQAVFEGLLVKDLVFAIGWLGFFFKITSNIAGVSII